MKTIYLLALAILAFALAACTGLTPQENQELLALQTQVLDLQKAITASGLTPELAGQLAAAMTRMSELTSKALQSGGSLDWEMVGAGLGGVLTGVLGRQIWRNHRPTPAPAPVAP